MKFLLLLSALAAATVEALVQSPAYTYNVTSPDVNAPYVASQILPCIYDVADNATSDTLQLSIILVGTNSSVVLTQAADISQGFSYEKQVGGATVYEHQFNYNIPSNTTAGSYQVVFADNVSQTNVSIPITISAAPVVSSTTAIASASSSTPASSSVPASIFNKDSAATTLNAGFLSKALLVGSIAAFVQL